MNSYQPTDDGGDDGDALARFLRHISGLPIEIQTGLLKSLSEGAGIDRSKRWRSDTVKGYGRVLLSLGAYGSQQAIQEALVKKEREAAEREITEKIKREAQAALKLSPEERKKLKLAPDVKKEVTSLEEWQRDNDKFILASMRDSMKRSSRSPDRGHGR